MFGSEILDVAVGVIFIFVLVSIICSVVREAMEAWLKTRAAFLEHGIRELLHDPKAEGIARSFYEHPLIYSLFAYKYKPGSATKRPSSFTNGSTLPSYIPAQNFALALMDIAARGRTTDAVSSDPASPRMSLEAMRLNLENIGNPAVQRVMLTAIDSAQGDLAQAQANIEAWFDSGMDRVSGWYKRSSQWVIFWVGLFVAVSLNINPITIANYLAHDDAARATVVARAQAAVNGPNDAQRNYYAARSELDSLRLPIGWERGWGAPIQGPKGRGPWNTVLGPLLGWLLTAFAAMLGAPFWFDVLNKVMVIRSTVKPHEKSPEEASEDRLPPPRPVLVDAAAAAGVAPARAANPAPPPEQAIYTPRDPDSNKDGCDVEVATVTPDDALPPAEGGVA